MVIRSTRVWHKEVFRPLEIEIEGSQIVNVLPYGTCGTALDYGDCSVIPGLVDIHNHGYDGLDCNHATSPWLRKWLAYLPEEGVTSILAATSSSPEETMLEGMRAIADAIDERPRGTQILGVYSEGPMISFPFRGAQNEAYLVRPSAARVEKYQDASRGYLRYCCIAPEEDKGMAAIRYCAEKGIRVSIGHTGASFCQCTLAREAGAVSFAHTFNGMRGLQQREPGTVGAAMYYDDMYTEVIGDGIHVDFHVVNILGRLKGKDKLILVTDSVQIKGLSPGEYHMPDRDVILGEDGAGRLPSGSIAGSTAKMNELLRNLIEHAHLPEAIAINAATCNPLKMLGLDRRKGYIAVGYDADIAVLNSDYSVRQTYVMGESML